MRPISLLVIHCTGSPNGRQQTIRDIDAWHRQRGFHRSMVDRRKWQPELTSIGYHYLIGIDGTVTPGRSLDEIGAHAQGHNATSAGVCLVGTDRFTPAQWTALKMVIQTLERKFPQASVCGHRDLPDVHKVCPGFEVGSWITAGMQPLEGHTLT